MSKEKPQRRRRDLDSPYLAIGRLAANWSHIEYELDHCLYIIYSNCHGSLVKRKCPVGFKPRLELLVQALRTESRLSGLTKKGLKIAAKMSRLAKHRNLILHGTIMEFSPSVIIFVIRELGGRIPMPKRISVRVDQIERQGKVMEDFALDLGYFLVGLECAFGVP
jgi:hypothetical protein